jgi:pimeloyl-ACP methyl ester carboxylesterase
MDVILIAGLWLDASVWSQVATELERIGQHPIPVALPGQGDGSATATLDDQLTAVLAAVDAAERPVVVGHSAASSLAWLAADRHAAEVARVVLIGGFPNADGEAYADFFPVQDGVMPFPGWAAFDGPDTADLDDAARQGLAAGMVPVPEGVAKGIVELRDDRRYDVPITLVCPEFTPAQAKAWIAEGQLPELAKAHDVSFVDIDSGHWPMSTRPVELARLLAQVAATGAPG